MECAKALNDHEHGEVRLSEHTSNVYDALDRELFQTAAMAMTWWMNRRGHALAPQDERAQLHALLEQIVVENGAYAMGAAAAIAAMERGAL